MNRVAATLTLSCFLAQFVACTYTKTLPVDDELASSVPKITSDDGLMITGYATRDGDVHAFKGKVTAAGDEFVFRPATHQDVRTRDELEGEPFRVPRSEVDRFMVSATHVGRSVVVGIGSVTVMLAAMVLWSLLSDT